MRDLAAKSLLRELILLIFAGGVLAACLFVSLVFVGNGFLDEYFIGSDFIFRMEQPFAENLQGYVQEHAVSAADADALWDWAYENKVRRLTVSRDNILLYDNALSDEVITGYAVSEYLNYRWPYFHTVTFLDGDADVYIDKDFALPFYIALDTGIGLVSMAAWIALLIWGIRRKVRYIQELRSGVLRIESGDLETEIAQRGRDELYDLAHGFERMRGTLLEKTLREKEIQKAHAELVTGMAHDLRTPLTALTTYMELAGMQEDPMGSKRLISKAVDKALQIREMTDRLFETAMEDPLGSTRENSFGEGGCDQPQAGLNECLYINKTSAGGAGVYTDNSHTGDAGLYSDIPPARGDAVELLPPENAEYAIGEYLSELCALLEAGGIGFDTAGLAWEPVRVRLSIEGMGRIVDNILSNIRKYADPSAPVIISSAYEKERMLIVIQNSRRSDPSDANEDARTGMGKGVGIRNMQKMMAQMNGSCTVEEDGKTYAITLAFPITNGWE